jgi:GNAT superfamily N-acetyltransferase
LLTGLAASEQAHKDIIMADSFVHQLHHAPSLRRARARYYEYEWNGYWISTDPHRLDLDVIHGFLQHSYWSPGIPRPLVAAAVGSSFCFGLYTHERQIGFVRVVTDFASVAYIADVFVLPAHRGQGLATWLMRCVVDCPDLAQVRSLLLATRDAHGLYQKVGFQVISKPELWMASWRAPAWRRPELIHETEPPAKTGSSQSEEASYSVAHQDE